MSSILILGGTRFLGRHLVEAALARDHVVTLFNRGLSSPDLFPRLENLVGDRDGDLVTLEGRQWDAVIDTSGYVPRIVRASAELLAPATSHYTFISTISVYADFSQPGITETNPVSTLVDETVETVSGETYGPLKALCEQAVQAVMKGRSLVVRPGLIVGPHDPTDRFTYWPQRIARGGEVLAPGVPDAPVEFIDGRDLAEWIIHLVEGRISGVFNATGPAAPTTMGSLFGACRAVSDSQATLNWVPSDFLLEKEVIPWTELPLWLPQEEYAGIHQVDIRKAIHHGLSFRSPEETIQDTLTWANRRPHDHSWIAGLSPEREAELLQEWHHR